MCFSTTVPLNRCIIFQVLHFLFSFISLWTFRLFQLLVVTNNYERFVWMCVFFLLDTYLGEQLLGFMR